MLTTEGGFGSHAHQIIPEAIKEISRVLIRVYSKVYGAEASSNYHEAVFHLYVLLPRYEWSSFKVSAYQDNSPHDTDPSFAYCSGPFCGRGG